MLKNRKWKLKTFTLVTMLMFGGLYWKILYTGPLYEAKQALARLQKTPIFKTGAEPATTNRTYTLRSADDLTERERIDWGPYRARLVRVYGVDVPLSTLAELLIDWNPLATRSGFALVEACGWTNISTVVPSYVALKYRRGERSPFDFLTVTMEKGKDQSVVVYGYHNTEERKEKRPSALTEPEVARIRGGAEPKCE